MLAILQALPVYGQTRIDPIGALALFAVLVATVVLRRSRALLPLVLILTTIPAGQRLAIAGLDFTFLRITVLVLWVRIFARGEYRSIRWSAMDSAVTAFAGVRLVTTLLLWGSFDKVLLQLAMTLETAGAYFAFRALMRGAKDVRAMAHGLSWIAVGCCGFFLLEKSTGRNLFSALGGVELHSLVREGKLRAQGPMVHPIIAGCFWAAAAPLVAAPLLDRRGERFVPLLGLGAIVLIVFACASSTPLLSLIAGAGAMFLFRYRRHVWILRWGALIGAISLHVVMKKPIWHLIARIDVAGGSTGWHRYYLIDNFVKHWSEWLLYGVRSTVHWGRLMWDITNQYVLVGVQSGLVGLVTFLVLLGLAFQRVGASTRTSSRGLRVYAWAAGASLFVHTVSFIGVSYFGTIVPLLYLTLAHVAALHHMVAARARTRPRREVVLGARRPRSELPSSA